MGGTDVPGADATYEVCGPLVVSAKRDESTACVTRGKPYEMM